MRYENVDGDRTGRIGHLIGEGEQGSGSDLEGYELEPGIEVFLSQGRRMAVPFSAGDIRLEGAQKLLWQVALLAGINNKAPNMDLKLIVGYKLYFRAVSVWFSPIADVAPRRDRESGSYTKKSGIVSCPYANDVVT